MQIGGIKFSTIGFTGKGGAYKNCRDKHRCQKFTHEVVFAWIIADSKYIKLFK
jgi:hypothetical protein